ncbi:ABC transporter ATP-binding protein [Candidatus Wolfebacteria bacterium]|nr:ABC transporter ATP-binding protein [Candidatus Wolfebacteria bacterium]
MNQNKSEKDIAFWQFISKIFHIYKPFKWPVFFIFLMLFLSEAIGLINPYIYGKIIDALINGKPMSFSVKLLLISFGVSIFSSLLNYFKNRFDLEKIDFEIARYVSTGTLKKMLAFSIGQHENQNSGVKKSIIDRGEHSFTALAYTVIFDLAPMFLRIFVVVAALFFIAPILGTIIFIGLVIYIGLTLFINYYFKDSFKKIQDEHHKISKKHSEILRNVSLVKINAKEKETAKEYDLFIGKAYDFMKNFWIKFNTIILSRSFVMHLTRFSMMFAGIYLIYKKIYTPGFLITFWSWAGYVFSDLRQFSNLHRRIMEMYAAVKKYLILIDVESDVKEIEHPIKPEKFFGKIEFKNIYFKYPKREYINEDKNKEDVKIVESNKRTGKEYVLENINLLIEPGQKVAIVGPSGAGKSTLVHLLIRAYDSEKGSIFIDGNNLKDLELENFRSAFGIVSQDVALFDDTLRYNILFGTMKNEIFSENLKQAVKMACLDKFIVNLEKGLDTIIGERGIKLSGGERQRVGIARALIKNPSILIFDEATSNLDTENEMLIRNAIEKFSKNRTTIIVAHRLSTIKGADKIIVMENGRIVGEGKHDDLLETCKAYQRLINNQTVMVGGV